MKLPYLLLWLESPLQAWGADSKFGRRDTLNFPTKSGVLGLLCCALGKSGEQREFLAQFAKLSQTAISFVRSKSTLDHVSKKAEREILLCDFQMVGSGYNATDAWQNLLIPKTNEGKPPNGPGTKITYRYYLQDAFFAVILQTPLDIIDVLADALQNPVWDLYLGRKCCVPTDFIYRGKFATEVEAINTAVKIAGEKGLMEDFRVLDGEHENGEHIILNDVPIQFGVHKQYRDRYVTVRYL